MGDTHVLIVADQLHPGGAGRRAADRALFDAAILRILHTILGAELASAWQRYLRFAIVVVGVSGGVRPLDLEKYIAPNRPGATAPELSLERWTLELYRSLIDSLQSIAWMLLLFLSAR